MKQNIIIKVKSVLENHFDIQLPLDGLEPLEWHSIDLRHICLATKIALVYMEQLPLICKAKQKI